MGLLTLLLIALALSMDALAVAIACGISLPKVTWRHALTVGAWFGGFQALMPFAGWLAGTQFRGLIAGLDHWVAFLLLAGVGAHMVYEAFHGEEMDRQANNPLDTHVMLILAVATSIDAMGAGLTFALLETPIARACLLIGATTFAISAAGVWVGHRAGRLVEKEVRIIGGVVLIGIGGKILISHLCAS